MTESNKKYEKQDTFHYRKRASSHLLDINNNLCKIIIPYDFTNKTYALQNSIDFYDEKDYVINKLIDFVKNPLFSMDYEYKFTSCELLLSYLPNILITFIVFYFSSVILVNSFFNPGILLICIVLIYEIYYSLDKKRFISRENRKISKIKHLLDEENKTNDCRKRKLKWTLGMNGYWIEVIKI